MNVDLNLKMATATVSSGQGVSGGVFLAQDRVLQTSLGGQQRSGVRGLVTGAGEYDVGNML